MLFLYQVEIDANLFIKRVKLKKGLMVVHPNLGYQPYPALEEFISCKETTIP